MSYTGLEPGVQPSLSFLRSYKIPRKTGKNTYSVSDHDFRPIINEKVMPKARTKTKGVAVSESESEESGQLSRGSSDESDDSYDSGTSGSEAEAQTAEVQRDDHGPPSEEVALDLFYKEKKRVDAKPITCIIHKNTFMLYFEAM